MNEEERVEKINSASVEHLSNFLRQLDENKITEEDMLAIAYAAMITVSILGFSAEEMAKSAAIAADKLMDKLEEHITNEELTNTEE